MESLFFPQRNRESRIADMNSRFTILLALYTSVSLYQWKLWQKIENDSTAQTRRAWNQQRDELRVFVAASLTKVAKSHQETFEKGNNAKIIFNVGGSDTLYQQIASGSPADVFMAADFKWTKRLQENGFLHNEQYWNFTTNVIVVILPADNPANISDLWQLSRPRIRIVVTAWTVPAGKYTNMTLTILGATNPIQITEERSGLISEREL